MDYKNRNVLALAYLGDSVYEIYVREYLVKKGIEKVFELQKSATEYVSARGQDKYLKLLINNNILTDEELALVHRARNHKSHAHPKNTDAGTYHNATGLEALIGYLFLIEDKNRINEIMNFILGGNHEENNNSGDDNDSSIGM